eukprot:TRINITY_DN3182_c0_g1_i2.p1 TRINITY_DN3182_c0_g1~~TRINITY_DN3182_c0_g1_i2.p1  ORF type:complete len:874 (-),score=230.19 TRINITY_DN3182_c0_g1_i2:1424-4045(-)
MINNNSIIEDDLERIIEESATLTIKERKKTHSVLQNQKEAIISIYELFCFSELYIRSLIDEYNQILTLDKTFVFNFMYSYNKLLNSITKLTILKENLIIGDKFPKLFEIFNRTYSSDDDIPISFLPFPHLNNLAVHNVHPARWKGVQNFRNNISSLSVHECNLFTLGELIYCICRCEEEERLDMKVIDQFESNKNDQLIFLDVCGCFIEKLLKNLKENESIKRSPSPYLSPLYSTPSKTARKDKNRTVTKKTNVAHYSYDDKLNIDDDTLRAPNSTSKLNTSYVHSPVEAMGSFGSELSTFDLNDDNESTFDNGYETPTDSDIDYTNLKNLTNVQTSYKYLIWKQLKILNLSHNNINFLDESLALLPNLRVLDLSYNQIKEIHNLTMCESLVELNLSHNCIESMEEFVFELPNISKLNISHNQICSTSGIEKLVQITEINISYNLLSSIVNDISKLSVLPNLHSLDVSNNPLIEGTEMRILNKTFVNFALPIRQKNDDSDPRVYLNGQLITSDYWKNAEPIYLTAPKLAMTVTSKVSSPLSPISPIGSRTSLRLGENGESLNVEENSLLNVPKQPQFYGAHSFDEKLKEYQNRSKLSFSFDSDSNISDLLQQTHKYTFKVMLKHLSLDTGNFLNFGSMTFEKDVIFLNFEKFLQTIPKSSLKYVCRLEDSFSFPMFYLSNADESVQFIVKLLDRTLLQQFCQLLAKSQRDLKKNIFINDLYSGEIFKDAEDIDMMNPQEQEQTEHYYHYYIDIDKMDKSFEYSFESIKEEIREIFNNFHKFDKFFFISDFPIYFEDQLIQQLIVTNSMLYIIIDSNTIMDYSINSIATISTLDRSDQKYLVLKMKPFALIELSVDKNNSFNLLAGVLNMLKDC